MRTAHEIVLAYLPHVDAKTATLAIGAITSAQAEAVEELRAQAAALVPDAMKAADEEQQLRRERDWMRHTLERIVARESHVGKWHLGCDCRSRLPELYRIARAGLTDPGASPIAAARASIYRLIDAERARQQAKFGNCSISGESINNDKRIAIMVEELGEVAKAADELALRGGSYAQALRDELVQVAACAVGWLELFEPSEGR